MRPLIRALTDNNLNLLLAAAPASWVLDEWLPGSPWIFITAAVSLVPLAGIIGLGTEQLAHRAGPGIGGLVNAPLGDAAEAIIAPVARRAHHRPPLQAAITGS